MYQAPQHSRPGRPGLSAATTQAQHRLRLMRAQRGQTRLDDPNSEVDPKTAAGGLSSPKLLPVSLLLCSFHFPGPDGRGVAGRERAMARLVSARRVSLRLHFPFRSHFSRWDDGWLGLRHSFYRRTKSAWGPQEASEMKPPTIVP